MEGKDTVKQTQKPVWWASVLRYLIYFIVIAVSPLLASIPRLLDLFNWVGYGQMRPFVADIITMILWGVAMVVGFIVEGRRALKNRSKNAEDQATEQSQAGEETPKSKKEKQKNIFFSSPLPLKNVFILTAIVALCILVIGTQIKFQVKLFYDLGENVQGYELLNNISNICKNVVKCIWITWLLYASKEIALCVCEYVKDKKWSAVLGWTVFVLLMLLFGVYDVFTSGMALSLKFIYLFLCYPAFIAVYVLTKEHAVKSFVLILIIYIF